jgi:hypothetical protein
VGYADELNAVDRQPYAASAEERISFDADATTAELQDMEGRTGCWTGKRTTN